MWFRLKDESKKTNQKNKSNEEEIPEIKYKENTNLDISLVLDLTLRYTSVIHGPQIEEKITVDATYLENPPKSSGTKSNAKN